MSLPAITGSGEATLVTVICACAVTPTSVVAIAVLFAVLGSVTDELAVTESVITVPFVAAVYTFTTSEKRAAVLPAMLTLVQTTLPVAPTSGVVQVQPAG